MFPAFLLTKLSRAKNIAVYTTTNPATFFHNTRHFLRRISSNTSSAAEISSLVNQSSELSASSKRLEKSTSTKKELNRDHTLSFLVESCGLSPKDALTASGRVNLVNPEKARSVLDLLSNHGFSKTQISNTVRRCPWLLILDPEKIILPKLEFLKSMGVSKIVLAYTISYCPNLLARSLKKQIEPVCNIIKSFVKSDKMFCSAMKRGSWLFLTEQDKFLVPNIAILQEMGVSDPNIALLLTQYPRVLMHNPEQFSAHVSKVKGMGFNPLVSTFILALQAATGMGEKMTWDRCYKMYSSKWGWSDEDILSAFKRHPHCMIMSEKRLNSAMELLVNTMGWSSKCISQQPIVLLFSLEKRLIPRCSVIRVLWTKGLLSKDLSPRSILDPPEKRFLERFVTKYEQEVPQLFSVYEGKMDPLDL